MGDLCLYWKDILVSKQKLNNNYDIEYYKNKSNIFIIDGMRQGASISQIKQKSMMFVQVFGNRRLNKQKVSSSDHTYFLCCILFLIKIGVFDEDDYILQCFRKRHLCSKKSPKCCSRLFCKGDVKGRCNIL